MWDSLWVGEAVAENRDWHYRVGVLHWHDRDGMASSIADLLSGLGCDVVEFINGARLPAGLDVVLAYGPFRSLVPLANQLLAQDPSRRPRFALWLTEQLSDPRLPEWLHYAASVTRSHAERWAFRQTGPGEWRVDPRLRWITTNAHRFRYYGDLVWLQKRGLLSVLAVGSRWITGFLRARGFDPITVYLGSHPTWGADMGLERDIPVLWLGQTATRRRSRMLANLRRALQERGIEMLMVDGVENPGVYGEERTRLLNRTKIVVNVLRATWDNHSLRYFLAAPNRALVVTEPTFPHIPFWSGIHHVEVSVGAMVPAIEYYLSHEDARRKIADRAHRLVTQELTMQNSLSQILAQVSHIAQVQDAPNVAKRSRHAIGGYA